MTDAPKKRRGPSGRGCKAKGDAYERELANHIGIAIGQDVRRAPLSGGGVIHGLSGGADINGTPGIHIEAKRVERLNFHDAIKQAESSLTKSKAPEHPVVINRRNGMATGQSLVTMRLDAFLELYGAWLTATGGRPKTA